MEIWCSTRPDIPEFYTGTEVQLINPNQIQALPKVAASILSVLAAKGLMEAYG
jgi:hypothetical protein